MVVDGVDLRVRPSSIEVLPTARTSAQRGTFGKTLVEWPVGAESVGFALVLNNLDADTACAVLLMTEPGAPGVAKQVRFSLGGVTYSTHYLRPEATMTPSGWQLNLRFQGTRVPL